MLLEAAAPNSLVVGEEIGVRVTRAALVVAAPPRNNEELVLRMPPLDVEKEPRPVTVAEEPWAPPPPLPPPLALLHSCCGVP